tara:strand:- start:2321 stop:2743 length:423 start_codon:yes stop_codon:yes gene_type:complete
MSVPEYLMLLDACEVPANHKTYTLTNQLVRNGRVYFKNKRALLRLLEASENGRIPEDILEHKRRIKVINQQAADSIELKHIDNLVGPNSDGYYHGRCPVCASEGKDRSADNFWFNENTNEFACFAGHTTGMIVDFLKAGE